MLVGKYRTDTIQTLYFRLFAYMSEKLSVSGHESHYLDTDFHHFDRLTLQRLERAYRARINLLTLDLPREMGYDHQVVDAQRIIDIAEKKGVIDKLCAAVGATTTGELVEKIINLPKTGPVGKTLGGVAHMIGITYEEMTDQKMFIRSFLRAMDSAEAVEKLKEALTKLGY